jgi:hypothetical protein
LEVPAEPDDGGERLNAIVKVFHFCELHCENLQSQRQILGEFLSVEK